MVDERIEHSTGHLADEWREMRHSAVRSVRAGVSGVLRRAGGMGMRGVRAVHGVPGFATAMIDVETLASEPSRPGVSIQRWSFEEPPPQLDVIPHSDPVPEMVGVRTTLSMLDITAPGYSLRHGHLIDPERRVIYESKVVASFPVSRIAMMPLERPSHTSGVVACLCQAANYGHWNLLALPLVPHYRQALGADPDYYYVGANVSSWQLDSLAMLGIPESKLLRGPVTADRLLVAIADRFGGYDTDFLLYADSVLQPAPSAAAPANRRLFVSRANATQRRLLNEGQCMDALRDEFGIELVATEKMTLADEIALFRQAELVLGVKGAGLTNAIFAPAGGALIEFSSNRHEDSQISQIAPAKGLRYGIIRGQSRGLCFGVPASRHDFEIDNGRVVEIVRAALTPAP